MAEKSERERIDEKLRGIVLNLPEKPGCYQYLDETGTIIYVGKAKNLKRRVSSYFNREHQNRKTAILVSKIRDIKYIIVNTEEDALLLENNLIKKYKPRYNILLKDCFLLHDFLLHNSHNSLEYKSSRTMYIKIKWILHFSSFYIHIIS